MIGFTIEGAPVPKGRPRFTRTGHTFTPAKTRQYEALVTARAREAMIGKKSRTQSVWTSSPSFLCPRHGLRNAAQRLCKVSSITSQSRTLTTCRRRFLTA